MINLTDANAILGIKKVGELFSNDATLIKNEHKDLCRIWHPDNNNDPKANDVFVHINKLYKTALDLIANNLWEKDNYIQFKNKDGKLIQINYLKVHTFELGTMYICNTCVVYILNHENKDLYENALKQIKKIKYADKMMETEFKRYMPNIISNYETIDDKYCIVISKTEDTFCLYDIYEYYNHVIPDRHVAWIISRLCNVARFLDYNGLVNNGINLMNCFISPEFHTIMLYGGWWYTNKKGKDMVGTSQNIFDILPLSVKSNKKASTVSDLESVKLMGRTLLGDKIGTQLINKGIPKPIINWVCDGSSNNVMKEYEEWEKVLKDAYGQRKFIKMEVLKNDIYKTN
jgi:hypothetical protein